MTTTQWNDFILRKGLNDTGAVPYTGGGWTNSPDLIPYGTNVVGNPATAFGATTYAQDLGQPTVFETPNYFYMRAKNLSAGAQTGSLYLYYCPQNLFLFPSLWNKNQMLTSSGKDSVAISAAKTNDIAMTSEPFTYIPTNQIHSCLIGRVVTPTNPNPLPQDGDFQTMDDLATYIVNPPNMAWRNVVLVDNGIPTVTNSFQIDTTSLKPGTTGLFLLGISFNNLTVGSELAFSAGTPIPSGPDQGKVISLTRTAVTQTNGSLGTSYLTIPAGYKTNVTYSYWAKAPIMKNWNVSFYAVQVLQPGHALAKQGRNFHELGVGIDKEHPINALNSGMSTGILVGSVTTIGN